MLRIGTNTTAPIPRREIAEGIGPWCGAAEGFSRGQILLLAIFPRSVPGDPCATRLPDVNSNHFPVGRSERVFYLGSDPSSLTKKATSFQTRSGPTICIPGEGLRDLGRSRQAEADRAPQVASGEEARHSLSCAPGSSDPGDPPGSKDPAPHWERPAPHGERPPTPH